MRSLNRSMSKIMGNCSLVKGLRKYGPPCVRMEKEERKR